MKNSIIRLVILLAAVVPGISRSAEYFEITKEGKPACEIVLAPNTTKSAWAGANDLKEFFQKISGADVAIVEKPTGKFGNVIYVGESELTRKAGFHLKGLEKGGYKLSITKNRIIAAGRDFHAKLHKFSNTKHPDPAALKRWQDFAGEPFGSNFINTEPKYWYLRKNPMSRADDTGSWYATSELLERLGVRFYAPGEDGTVIPKNPNLRLPVGEIVRKPAAMLRYFTGQFLFEYNKWFKRIKNGMSEYLLGSHTANDLMTKELIAKYPSIVAHDKNGKTLLSFHRRVIPKFSDPVLEDLSVKYLDAVFKAYREVGLSVCGAGITPPDGLGRTDYEDRLKFKPGTDQGPGEAYPSNRDSDYIWDYWYRVGKKLQQKQPHAKFSCSAYASYVSPPQNKSLILDNMIIGHVYSSFFMLEHHPFHKKFISIQDQWLKLVGPQRYLVWNHYLPYWRDETPYPHFFTAAIDRDAKKLKGYMGKFIEINQKFVTRNGKKSLELVNPGLMHFTIYFQSLLFWNPDADRKAVMDEYFKLYFGPAENEMRKFYELAEERSNAIRPPLFKFTEKTLTEYNNGYFSILEAAMKKCPRDSVYYRRVAQIADEMAPLKKIPQTLVMKGEKISYRIIPAKKPDADYAAFNSTEHTMRLNSTGEMPAGNLTKVKIAFSKDRKMLYVIARCYETDMSEITAKCVKNKDRSIFDDDNIEVYIATPEYSYFKITSNLNGVICDESTDPMIIARDTLPMLWVSGAKTAVKKLSDSWIIEFAIPTADFGKTRPSSNFPWLIQVSRTRVRNGKFLPPQALAPTGKGFNDFTRWGILR